LAVGAAAGADRRLLHSRRQDTGIGLALAKLPALDGLNWQQGKSGFFLDQGLGRFWS
jgi:hypothetical protein